MIFEGLPTTPRSEELVDKAFSRAARAGRAKRGHEAQESMLRTAGNVLSDNLENVVVSWPDFGFDVDPFYYEIADAIVDVDRLRQALSQVMWASRQIEDLRDEYTTRIRNADVDTARKHRKQAFARMADVMDQIADDLRYIGDSRDDLRDLPEIRPDDPAIVVAGYPNVGKSSFVNRVTRASNEIAEYPFTTRGVHVGHFDREHVRYQIVDTPGLLDRPEDERNDIERQAVSALRHLADVVLFVLDPSGDCGYPLDVQLELRREVRALFDESIPMVTVANKHDRFDALRAESVHATMSLTEDENVDRVLDMVIDAVDHEPDLPTRDGE